MSGPSHTVSPLHADPCCTTPLTTGPDAGTLCVSAISKIKPACVFLLLLLLHVHVPMLVLVLVLVPPRAHVSSASAEPPSPLRVVTDMSSALLQPPPSTVVVVVAAVLWGSARFVQLALPCGGGGNLLKNCRTSGMLEPVTFEQRNIGTFQKKKKQSTPYNRSRVFLRAYVNRNRGSQLLTRKCARVCE